jgi:hypothetical protein
MWPSPDAPTHKHHLPGSSLEILRDSPSVSLGSGSTQIAADKRSFPQPAHIDLTYGWQVLGRQELRQECYKISPNRPRYTTDSHIVQPKRGRKQAVKSKNKPGHVGAEPGKVVYRKKHALAEHDRRLRHKSLLVQQYEEILNDISLKEAGWEDPAKAPTKEIILKAMKTVIEMFRWLDNLTEEEHQRIKQESERNAETMLRREGVLLLREAAVARREKDVAEREEEAVLCQREEGLARKNEAVTQRGDALSQGDKSMARGEAAFRRREIAEVLCPMVENLARGEQASCQKDQIVMWQREMSTKSDRLIEDMGRISLHVHQENCRPQGAYKIVEHSPACWCHGNHSYRPNDERQSHERLGCRWKPSDCSSTSVYSTTTSRDKSPPALSESFLSTESEHTKRKWEEGEESKTPIQASRRAVAKQLPESGPSRPSKVNSLDRSWCFVKPF